MPISRDLFCHCGLCKRNYGNEERRLEGIVGRVNSGSASSRYPIQIFAYLQAACKRLVKFDNAQYLTGTRGRWNNVWRGSQFHRAYKVKGKRVGKKGDKRRIE